VFANELLEIGIHAIAGLAIKGDVPQSFEFMVVAV
jgi:hypothetical protein